MCCDPVLRTPLVLREAARGGRRAGRPLAGREICLDCRSDDRVHEAQRPTLLEDPGSGELVRSVSGGPRVQLGQASRDPKLGLAQHGRRACQLAGAYGEAPQPQHD